MTVAVITGASTGIGRATALRLASRHEVVFAGVRNPDTATELHESIDASNTTNIVVLPVDVDDDASVSAAFSRVHNEAGPVDVLVNNAGVSGAGNIEETPLSEFRRQMETNLFGLLRCTQAVLPAMRERRSGTIVNISSLAGRFVRQGMGPYSATKHAVEAVSDALAQEVAEFGIRVVVIEPGVVRTAIWGKTSPGPADSAYGLAAAKTMVYFRRMLRDAIDPEFVAGVIADAITTDSPALRYPVGWDAETILAARQTVTDETIVEMAALGLDEWKAAWAREFGFPLD